MIKVSAQIFSTATISHKIFGTNSSFHVKERNAGKVQLLFFGTFLLVLPKFSFWQGECALDYHFMKFGHFLNIP